MSKLLVTFVAVSFVLRAPPRVNAQTIGPDSSWVQSGEYRLKTSAFKSDDVNKHPTLVVALHGDAPFEKPGYQYTFASNIAAHARNIVAVGLLRPGYSDPQGNTSEGERGKTNGDNWNIGNTDAIADAIRKLKDRHQSHKVVVAGHSGGATITANILGRHPQLINAALLVACPCDAERWRKHMFEQTGDPVFKGDIETLSPIEHIQDISDMTNIIMVVGRQDEVAPPYLSKSYQAKASELGKSIRLVRLKDKGHNIFLDPKVLTILASMLP